MSWRARLPDPADGPPRGVTAAALAERLGGELLAADELPDERIARVRAPERAGPGEVAVLPDGDPAAVADSRAALLVIGPDAADPGRPAVRVDDPRAALATLIDLLHPLPPAPRGVHPAATVAPSARLDDSVLVGPGARIEGDARIDAGAEIHANSVIGAGCVIGRDTVIHPNVTLYPGTRVGARVEIQSGAVIGASGFGLLREARGAQRQIPQVGVVVIEDDVLIGANCAIDRATLEATVVGRGTKIDNLVQIGHNTRIGAHCCIIAQTGVAGSVTVGDRCVLLAQSGVKDHVVLADDVYLGAQAGAARNLTAGEWLGTPAIPAALARRALVALSRLPALLREVRSLRRASGGGRTARGERSDDVAAEDGTSTERPDAPARR